jgi:CheY-like chemotaxis protein/GAF domain-containing protein
MRVEFYGAVIALLALALMPVVARIKRRLATVSLVGWGKLYLALSLFLTSGIVLVLTGVPSFMGLFMPNVGSWFRIAALLLQAIGLLLIIWAFADVASGVRRIQRRQSDEEGWQEFYANLQEMSLQPFSFVEILNMSLKQLLERSESDGAAVLLFKENSSELILAAFSGLSPETIRRLERLQVSGDIFGRAQKLGREQVVSNLADSDKMTEELFADSGYLSAAVFPLRSQEKTTGSLALLSSRPFHFNHGRVQAAGVAANFLATILAGVRQEKELTRLRDKLRPSEEAKRITEELFFRRGFGGDLQLREAVEFERVRKFFDADCIKLVARDRDGEFRIKASSGGAEMGLMLEQRKLTGINRAVNERKLLLLTSPQSKPAGGGYDSMPRQVLFVPVPYPDRSDLVLLLESETASLQFSKEKLSAVRVASVYLADLHFLFLEKRKGERYRNSIKQAGEMVARVISATSAREVTAVLGEAAVLFLPSARARMTLLRRTTTSILRLQDWAGLTASPGVDLRSETELFSVLGEYLLNVEAQISEFNRKSFIDEFAPDNRESVRRLFDKLPDTFQQIVLAIADGQQVFGVVAIYFTSTDHPAEESVELYRRLVELAGVQLGRLSQVAAAPLAEAPPLPAETLQGLNDVATRIVATAQLLEATAPGDDLPVKYVDGLERISDAAVQIGDLVKELGQKTAKPEPANADGRDGDGSRSESLVQWLGEHHVESVSVPAEVDNNTTLSDGIKQLVTRAFTVEEKGKIYLSSTSDDQYAYFMLSLDPSEKEHLQERVTGDNNWIRCDQAVILPEQIRSMTGELQLVQEGEEISTLIWRVPRSGNNNRGLRILGIDDQEAIRELLNNIITGLGHQVKTVADSSEALRLLGRELYDVVIVEVALPGQSGWEIARQVKAQSPRTPVIMLSGWDYQEQRVGEERRHADFVLTKPFKMEQLRKAIADAAAMLSA